MNNTAVRTCMCRGTAGSFLLLYQKGLQDTVNHVVLYDFSSIQRIKYVVID